MGLTAAGRLPKMPQMALRQHLAASLGREVQGLEADQGPRLEKLIWRLSTQAGLSPGDLDTAVAYNLALTRAGRIAEARAEALRLLGLVRNEGNAVSTWMLLNTAGALIETGLPALAMTCVEQVLARDVGRDPVIIESILLHANIIAVRYGELDWYAQHVPLVETLRLMTVMGAIFGQGLSPWWPAQQRAIETTLGEHVASAYFEVQDWKDGTSRIVLEYFTDLESHHEIGELQDAVLEAVSAIYAEHPEGPGAFLGKVLIDLHGPEVPLRELGP